MYSPRVEQAVLAYEGMLDVHVATAVAVDVDTVREVRRDHDRRVAYGDRLRARPALDNVGRLMRENTGVCL
jgi:hypothetical protein